MSNSFDEKYFDNLLRQVLIDIEEDKINKSERIYLDFKDKPTFKTTFHHKWCMRRLKNSYQKENRTKQGYSIGKIAINIIIITIILFSATIFASADIFKIFQKLGFYSEEFIDISISSDYTKRILEETSSWKYGNIYVPGTIPYGYELDNIITTSTSIAFKYITDDNDYLLYSINILGKDSIVSADNKETDINKFKFKGYDEKKKKNTEVNILTYETNEYNFRLISNTLNKRNLTEIAQNLENLEKLVVN